MVDVSTIILLFYAYTFGVVVLGLICVRRTLEEPNTELCRHCRLYRVCSKLGLNRIAPPVRYVRRASRGFKIGFSIALGAGCAAILVLATLACREALPYVAISLLLPIAIARSIAEA